MAKNDSGASSTQTAKSDSSASSTPTNEPVVVATPKAKGPKRYFVALGRALTCARGVISGDDPDAEIKATDLIGQVGSDDEKLKSAQAQLEELAAKGYLRTE